MQVVATQGRRGSEYVVVKGTRFRAPKGSRVKPGKVNLTGVRKGSVLVTIGGGRRGAKPGSKARTERWPKAAPLKKSASRAATRRGTRRT